MSAHVEIFLTFLRLGVTSFGGPVAHLGFFHQEFVSKKKWLSEEVYGELVALCQLLPGPASSQVGMAIGLSRGGILGALLAWIAFTLPSAIILILFGMGMSSAASLNSSLIPGLKIVAVSVVAHAVYHMAKKLCPDLERKTMALLAAVLVLYLASPHIQIVVMVVSAFIGMLLFRENLNVNKNGFPIVMSKRQGMLFLFLFFFLLFSLPLLREFYPTHGIKLFDSFYRAGSLVFGGGHVVLPLLEKEMVTPGWVSKDVFMAGYGLAQAIPGPLFAFSAYLGAVSLFPPYGFTGAILCLCAAFLPAFLLIIGIMPFWGKLRSHKKIHGAIQGINASVVGLLLAALYSPVWTSAIFELKDFLIAVGAFALLEFFKMSSWLVVIITVFATYTVNYF